jgi:hypothetical protein
MQPTSSGISSVKRKRIVVDHVDPVVDRTVVLIQNLRRSAYRPPPTRGDCVEGVPNTGSKADRIAGRAQCQAYTCRHNLLMTDSANVPGRRHNGLAPEWTLTERGNAGSPSCALDVADTGPKTADEISKLTGFTKRRIEQVLKKAKDGAFGADIARLAGDE